MKTKGQPRGEQDVKLSLVMEELAIFRCAQQKKNT